MENINLGTVANDGTGDTLREGGEKINANFAELSAAIAAVAGSAGHGVASGGGVAWESGLIFRVSAATYFLDGILYESAEQTVTLDVADATHPRIDVIALDETGPIIVEGTPAADPVKPDVDPLTQIELTFVLVNAGETAPAGGVTVDYIYQENAEWTTSTSGTGWDVASTTDPHAGTLAIEGTAVANGAYVNFAKGSTVNCDDVAALVLYIKSKAAWTGNQHLRFRFLLSGVGIGTTVALKDGRYGFSSSNTASDQAIIIPVADFNLPAGTTLDALRMTAVTAGIGCHVDDVSLQLVSTGIGGGGSTGSGLTQAQADARYIQLTALDTDDTLAADSDAKVPSQQAVKAYVDGAVAGAGGGDLLSTNNLSDVASAPTSRTNLGLGTAAVEDASDFAPSALTISTQSGTSYTLVLGDAGDHIRFTNGSAIALTVPQNSLVAFPVGTRIRFTQAGAGVVTIGGSGVTLNSRDGALDSAGQYAVFEIEKVATDEWDVLGDVA